MNRIALLAVIASFAVAPTFAEDMPTRKAGLWEIKMGSAQGMGQAIQHCIDAATDKALTASTGVAKDCSNDIKKTAGGMVINAVCTVNGTKMSSHSEVTGSFDSAYTMKITSDAPAPSGGPGQIKQITMTIEAKWLGPCKPDQKPGDMIMPGGMKLNVTDMPRAPGGAPGAR